VYLVDEHRLAERLPIAAGSHPFAVAPLVGIEARHPRCRSRRPLHRKAQRIGLDAQHPFLREDFVLVQSARDDVGHEQLEDAGSAEKAHREEPPIPIAEIAEHTHPSRVRRPHGKGHPVDSLDPPRVCSQELPEIAMTTLAEKV
jgi:hypothetical protein